MTEKFIKKTLPHSKDFKKFWKENGPFKYALTSKEFPPVLLRDEEWIFSDDITTILKTLMQPDQKKIKFVKSPFNPENKKILRPDDLSEWKINNFPEQWNNCQCDLFAPQGHLTRTVIDALKTSEKNINPKQVEKAFFKCLETRIERLGYLLLKPAGSSRYAEIKTYLEEWEKDEQDAGLL